MNHNEHLFHTKYSELKGGDELYLIGQMPLTTSSLFVVFCMLLLWCCALQNDAAHTTVDPLHGTEKCILFACFLSICNDRFEHIAITPDEKYSR